MGKATHVKGQTPRWNQHVYEARKWTPTDRRGNRLKIETIREILNHGLKPVVNIIFETTEEQEALDKEIQTINSYGLIRDGTGRLTNILRESYIPATYQHAHATKALISKTRKERISAGKIAPTKHTEEHKQKLKIDNPGGKATSKQVLQIDSITGDVIKCWNSTRSAGKSLGISSWRNISTGCNHNNGLVGGYYWRWVDDPSVQDNTLINVGLLNIKREGKPVLQKTTDGTPIFSWFSIKDATNQIQCGMSTIGWACKNNKPTQGFLWEYI